MIAGNNYPPPNLEFLEEESNLETPATHELPSYLRNYLKRFGDGSFTICEDCNRDQVGTVSPMIQEDGVQEMDITH